MKRNEMSAILVLLVVGSSVSAASLRYGVKAGLAGANQDWEYSNAL